MFALLAYFSTPASAMSDEHFDEDFPEYTGGFSVKYDPFVSEFRYFQSSIMQFRALISVHYFNQAQTDIYYLRSSALNRRMVLTIIYGQTVSPLTPRL